MLNNRTICHSLLGDALCSLAVIAAGCLLPWSMAQVPAGAPAEAVPDAAGSPAQPGVPAAAEKPEEPPPTAERDIDAAIKKIAKLKSVSAELVQEINMLNQKYHDQGTLSQRPQ